STRIDTPYSADVIANIVNVYLTVVIAISGCSASAYGSVAAAVSGIAASTVNGSAATCHRIGIRRFRRQLFRHFRRIGFRRERFRHFCRQQFR
ncbi:hypothetical protein LSAT2_013692, partial [Lamellibrachia satsuma]